jgi:aryl-alcohol dehydrogenase-like predicted oxidoreductase
MEKRPFGKTGKSFPLLSLGCQRIVDAHDCTQDQAVEILNTAIDRGIEYFDTAWVYSQGQSESRVGLVAKDRRNEMWIATKATERTKDGALKQLEESLKRLQTDHVDEWRMHDVFSMEQLDLCLGKGGVVEAMEEAKRQGMVKHISISGHTNPQVQKAAIERYDFDSVLMAASILDHMMFSFASDFLPYAVQKGIGTIGMKVFALGKLGDIWDTALKYTLSLPLSTTIVGCSTLDELNRDIDLAESFVPMTDQERLAAIKEIMPRVQPANMAWKADGWVNPSKWWNE